MKIAYLDIYHPFPINSGVDWYRYQLLDGLGKNNDLTLYHTLNSKDQTGYYPSDVNFDICYLKPKFNWNILSRNLEILQPERFLDRFAGSIEADVVFCCALHYSLARKLTLDSTPLVLVEYDLIWEYLKNNMSFLYPVMKFYENYAIKKANAIITLTKRDQEYVTNHCSNNKVFYIPPEIRMDIFKPLGPSINYGKGRFNLLFYGSLDRKHNLDALKFISEELIPALKKEHLTDDVRMNVFGSGANSKNIYLNNDMINFKGAVEDPGEYIRGADAILVPVKNNAGIKLRILESLACGKPVIATTDASEGLPIEIRNMLYIADTVNEFIEIIKDMITNECKEINPDFIRNYLSGDRLSDVISHINS